MDNASLMKELEILKTENETLKSKLAFTKSHLFNFVDTYIKYNEIKIETQSFKPVQIPSITFMGMESAGMSTLLEPKYLQSARDYAEKCRNEETPEAEAKRRAEEKIYFDESDRLRKEQEQAEKKATDDKWRLHGRPPQ